MKRRPPRSTLFPYTPPFRSLTPLDEARRAFERDYLVRILKITGGNVTKAARLAGRNRTEFYRLLDRKSTRLNSSHANISYAVFCLKKKYTSDYSLPS